MKFARKIDIGDWINISAILLILGIFVFIGNEYSKAFELNDGDIIKSAENFKEFLLSYGNASLAVMLFFHCIQVIVSFIPAALVQFAGGMIYGMAWGMLSSIVGVAIGTAISFYLSRLLGRRAVTLFVSEKSIQKLENWISGDTSAVVLLLMYICPGFPKDFISYFVGLTNMKASKLFIISAVGRLPSMFVSTYLGYRIWDENYAAVIIITVITLVIFVSLYVFKDKIMKFIIKDK